MSARKLTEDELARALEMAAKPLSWTNIARELGFKYGYEFINLIKQDPSFERHIRSARDAGLDDLAFTTIELVDKYENPNQARAQLEAIKWLCAVLDPAKYGQRVDVNLTQTISLKSAIDAAEQRIIDVSPSPIQIDNDINKLIG